MNHQVNTSGSISHSLGLTSHELARIQTGRGDASSERVVLTIEPSFRLATDDCALFACEAPGKEVMRLRDSLGKGCLSQVLRPH